MALVKTSFFRILSQFFFFLFLRSVVIFFNNWSNTLMFGFNPSFLGSSYTVGYSFNTLSSFLTPHPYRPQTLSRRVYQSSPLSWRVSESVFGGVFLSFLEFFFGSKALFFFVRNLWLHLGPYVIAYEYFFAHRICQYGPLTMRRKRGQWWWGSRVLALTVSTSDPELLISWVQTRLSLMSLYAHRSFFSLLGLLLRGAVGCGGACNLRGFYMRVVGNISVVGNAMSRVWWTRGGLAAGSNLTLQTFSGFTLVNTTTGCLGLSLSFFY